MTPVASTRLHSLYKPLKDHEIRLLRVLPQDQEGALQEKIECELQVSSLCDKVEYIALSYTWGSPVQEIPQNDDSSLAIMPTFYEIHCNGHHRVPVTQNLHDFLLRARSSKRTNLFWVDAVCINQQDCKERSEQVKLMSTIYRSALRVYAWLGEEDDHNSKGFSLTRSLAQICVDTGRHKRADSLKHITPRLLNTRKEAESDVFTDRGHWEALIRFFQRDDFCRAWIIQEISLGRTITAICGSHTLDWGDITIVSEFLTVTAWTRWISRASSISPLGNLCHHPVPNLVAANKDAQTATANNRMLYALIRFRRFRASNPRDKVYALLGTAGESVSGKSRFNPVYERSTEDVYTQAAIQILEDSNDLLLLTHAEGDAFRRHRDLPTWVPDWSCEYVLGLGVTGYQRYSAAANLPRSLLIQEETRSLSVKGFRLDDVVCKGETKREVLAGKPFPSWLAIWSTMPEVYHTGQPRLEVFWRTLITDTGGTPPRTPAPKHYGKAYVSWMASLLAEKSTSGDGEIWESLRTLMSEASQAANQHPDRQSDPDGPSHAEEYEVIFSHGLYLRLFLTRQGYLGVGSESLRENDSVWIVPGSRVPLILREAGRNTFEVVAGVYLCGFMQWEALEICLEPREITIV